MTERTPAMMRQALPCLPFDDVAMAVQYYVNVFGFHINHQQDNLCVMDRDKIRVLLIQRKEQHKRGSMYVYIKDADALHAELKAKGAKLLGEPVSHPWGLRDFQVWDLEENEITFGQPFD